MTSMEEPKPDLAEAANKYLLSLDASHSNEASLVINNFVRWCGVGRALTTLAPAEISRFSQQFSPTDTELSKKIEILRDFLVYMKKCRWITINLSGFVKPRKSKRLQNGSCRSRPAPAPVYLTPEGRAALKEELETLKAKKPDIIKSIKLAAADKDFRENSPLAAAKEEMGLVEGRINELEETLKIAVSSNQNDNNGFQVNIGNQVCLKETTTGEIICYTIVAAREANPLHGKISDSSPLGKALLGKARGDDVEINVPAGKICYTIERIDNTSA